METWVILVIVIVAVVLLASIIAVILYKRRNANLKSTLVQQPDPPPVQQPVQQTDIIGGIDEDTFKQLIATYPYYSDQELATQDNILNPYYIQTYIDDYIRNEGSVEKNPLLLLQQKFNTTYSTGFGILTSDVNLTDVEKIVFRYRKIRRHPSMTCFRNGKNVYTSVDYVNGHIQYKIHNFEVTHYINLSDIDDAISFMADTLQLNAV